MATASTTIVLYNPEEKRIISEVYEGQQYFRPENVKRYNGDLQEFIIENPEYTFNEEIEPLNF